MIYVLIIAILLFIDYQMNKIAMEHYKELMDYDH